MELSIDSAGAVAGVALTDAGALVTELTWRTNAGHASELLPAIEALLMRAGISRTDLSAIFVCLGPGSYGGLRVGISTAMALAFALDAGLLGIGRLEADAYQCAAFAGPIVPVHAAGRGEVAWAVYERGAVWQERRPPALSWPEQLLSEAPEGALLCGEVNDELADEARQSRPDLRVLTGPAFHRRPVTLAALAWPRFEAGARDSVLGLEPIYLREPNITPSRASRQAP